VVALFSAMLWIFYALIKSNETFLITINAAGCVIETIYVVMYFVYAPKKAKLFTAKIMVLLNGGVFGVILLLTLLLFKGSKRVVLLGWICVGFSVSVFVAPLSIMVSLRIKLCQDAWTDRSINPISFDPCVSFLMDRIYMCVQRRVIQTKSVEYMPFSLSLSLTLSAVVWFLYGLLIKDKYVAVIVSSNLLQPPWYWYLTGLYLSAVVSLLINYIRSLYVCSFQTSWGSPSAWSRWCSTCCT
jgi:solute carrier family 50 (sugar transporter)